MNGRTCRVCGCTDGDCGGCVERTGLPCWWVETTLCSACTGSALIEQERRRQIEKEGWSASHDDAHDKYEMAIAAAIYAAPSAYHGFNVEERPRAKILPFWPWRSTSYKPTPGDRVRELVKAGALIAAEIDRMNRLPKRKRDMIAINVQIYYSPTDGIRVHVKACGAAENPLEQIYADVLREAIRQAIEIADKVALKRGEIAAPEVHAIQIPFDLPIATPPPDLDEDGREVIEQANLTGEKLKSLRCPYILLIGLPKSNQLLKMSAGLRDRGQREFFQEQVTDYCAFLAQKYGAQGLEP